jgi:hypothetical protein
MTPVYFPFTYIGASAWRAITAAFEQIIVYQPCSQEIPGDLLAKVDSGNLLLRIPVRTEEPRLTALLRDYRIWAVQHQSGGSLEAIWRHAAAAGGIPLYENSAPTRIKSETQRLTSRPSPAPDPVFSARLFLSLAQELDVQSEAAADGLGRVDELERELLDSLRGGPLEAGQGPLRPEGIPAGGSADYMAAERLRAWTQLLLADARPEKFYLTSSRAAWQGCLDIGVDAYLLADALVLPGKGAAAGETLQWRRRTQELLQAAAESPRGDGRRPATDALPAVGAASQPLLTAAVVPAVAPTELFGAILAQRPLPAGKSPQPAGAPYTIIGLLDLG